MATNLPTTREAVASATETVGNLRADDRRGRENNRAEGKKDNVKTSPIHEAVEEGNVEKVAGLVKKMVKNDLEVMFERDGSGRTLLHLAALKGKRDIVDALLNALPDGRVERLQRRGRGDLLKVKDISGKTALHWAVISGRTEVVGALTERGSDANAILNLGDNLERSALYYAVEKSEPKINEAKGGGATHEGATNDKAKKNIVSLLLQAGASITAMELNVASKRGTKETVEILLEKLEEGKKQVNKISDENGMTALHWAAREGNSTVVPSLLRCRPLINAKTNKGLTALDLAAAEGKEEVVQILLRDGAESSGKDGLQAVDRALRSGNSSTMMLFIPKQ